MQPSAGRKLRHDGSVLFQMQLTDFAQEVFLWSWNIESLQSVLIHINQRKQITQQEYIKSPHAPTVYKTNETKTVSERNRIFKI